MKTIKTALRHIFCASALAFLAASMPGWAVPTGTPVPAFRPVLPALIGHTTIPILLPSWLPATSTGRWADSIAKADSYDVWLPDEAEHRGNAPHDWHTVDAERVGPKTPPLEGVRVALSGGRVGYYIASEWDARPSPATVMWTQNGVQYTVSEYAGTKEDVIRMANSMVLVRAGKRYATGVPNIAFRGVLAKVIRDTEVPVLLPTYLPAWPGGYYISVGDNERNAWPIYFQYRLDTGPGDDSADVGLFDAGKITPYTERVRKSEPPSVLVLLTGGRIGHYRIITSTRPRHDKGEVWWKQGGVCYTIQWQTRSRRTLIQIANSVVRARVGRGWPSAAAIDKYSESHVEPKSQYGYDARYSGEEQGGRKQNANGQPSGGSWNAVG